MKAEPAADLLAQTRLFAGLSSDALLRIAGQAHERSYRKGVVTLYEGDVGDALSIVADGTITEPDALQRRAGLK